VHVIMIFM